MTTSASATVSDTAATQAREGARSLASRNGLTVVELGTPAQLHAAAQLLAGIWADTASGTLPLTSETMRTLRFIGSYVAGAYAGRRLVGVGVGMLTEPDAATGHGHLHSHIVGVAADARGSNVGFAIKTHQRAWAVSRGITEISWTFDPLVRRNAFFNLGKLGGTATRYLVDFYGQMADELNTGQGSDRLLVSWRLGSAQVIAAAGGAAALPDPRAVQEAARVVQVGHDLSPQRTQVPAAGPLLIGIPDDVESLRQHEPGLARSWRIAVRDTMGLAMAAGYHVTGFSRAGWYVLQQPAESSR